MLGSWSKDNTLKEQIKNIIDSNLRHAQMVEETPPPSAAKNCTPTAVLIMTR
jgi:hypothetical protein